MNLTILPKLVTSVLSNFHNRSWTCHQRSIFSLFLVYTRYRRTSILNSSAKLIGSVNRRWLFLFFVIEFRLVISTLRFVFLKSIHAFSRPERKKLREKMLIGSKIIPDYLFFCFFPILFKNYPDYHYFFCFSPYFL